ncbi:MULTISPECIES: hypothetical protein [Cupriavidus]
MRIVLDFSKLTDPEHIAALEREREASRAVYEAKENRQRAAIRMLTLEDDLYAAMSTKEREFVRNVQRRMDAYQGVSDTQHRWLFDIVKRFGVAFESAPGHYAFRRDGAVISAHGPGLAHQTRHTTQESFLQWAEAQGVSPPEATAAYATHHPAHAAGTVERALPTPMLAPRKNSTPSPVRRVAHVPTS